MSDNMKDLLLREDYPLLDAIKILKDGPAQMVFVLGENDVLVGVLTNGDIRRFLLKGENTTSPVSECMNRNFHSVLVTEPRETLLKLFDLGYMCVPLIDKQGKILDFATPDFFPPPKEEEVLVRARAPVRLSFAGGGTDLTYYFKEEKGLVLSTSLALYARATLIPSASPRIKISSLDVNSIEEYASRRELIDSSVKGLLSTVVSVIQPEFGFELSVSSDFPVGSGLGGSSAAATSVVAAFNELRLDRWSNYEVAEISFHAERLCYGVSGGWQDQYASSFGGFNLIEFGGIKNRNIVHPIRLDTAVTNELEERLVLCDTNIRHDSGELHQKVKAEFFEQSSRAHFRAMASVSQKMHTHLIRGELKEFGLCMDEAWQLKRKMSSNVTNDIIDGLYKAAIEAGASGGKLLGAGSGGFFVFFVQPRFREAVSLKLTELGCTLRSVRFDCDGVTSWRTKAA